jgi:hypothetical protein
MTLQELLEHAHLDALGQLDEREQAAFEAAFAVAPPAIKGQVRNEQSRWAPMEHLLPQVEPSPELRERVLDAVTAAMVAQGAGELSMRPSRRVAPAWRAASIGLMTAVVVLGAAFAYVYQTARESIALAQNGATTDAMVSAFQGHVQEAMYSSKTVRSIFHSDDARYDEQGSVWTHPDWKQSVVFLNLPSSTSDSDYRLVVVSGGQLVRELRRLDSNASLQSCQIDKLPPNTQIAVVRATRGLAATLDTVLMTATV